MSDGLDAAQFVVIRLPRDASAKSPREEIIRAQCDFAELSLQMRRKRGRELASDVFADSAWYILLDLFVSRVEGGPASTSRVCARTMAPPSTALRYVALLERAGLIEHAQPAADVSDSTIQLTQKGFEKMQQLLAA